MKLIKAKYTLAMRHMELQLQEMVQLSASKLCA